MASQQCVQLRGVHKEQLVNLCDIKLRVLLTNSLCHPLEIEMVLRSGLQEGRQLCRCLIVKALNERTASLLSKYLRANQRVSTREMSEIQRVWRILFRVRTCACTGSSFDVT